MKKYCPEMLVARGKELLWVVLSDFCMNSLCHAFCSVLVLVISFPAQSKTVIPSLSLWSMYKALLSLLSALIGMLSYWHFPSENLFYQLLSAGFRICLQSWKSLCSKGLPVVCPCLCPAKASRRGTNDGSGWLSTSGCILP